MLCRWATSGWKRSTARSMPVRAEVDHSIRPTTPGPPDEAWRRRLEVHLGHERVGQPGVGVVGVGHAPEGDVVAGLHLERGDVLHVALGAALAVQELVHVQDPQRRSHLRRVGSGLAREPTGM